MGFAIFANAKELEVGISREGLELMSSSKCLMRSTVLVKGKLNKAYQFLLFALERKL